MEWKSWVHIPCDADVIWAVWFKRHLIVFKSLFQSNILNTLAQCSKNLWMKYLLVHYTAATFIDSYSTTLKYDESITSHSICQEPAFHWCFQQHFASNWNDILDGPTNIVFSLFCDKCTAFVCKYWFVVLRSMMCNNQSDKVRPPSCQNISFQPGNRRGNCDIYYVGVVISAGVNAPYALMKLPLFNVRRGCLYYCSWIYCYYCHH